MLYRSLKTGAEINSDSEIKAPNWVPVESVIKVEPPKEEPKQEPEAIPEEPKEEPQEEPKKAAPKKSAPKKRSKK